ncbi:hypothetical protein QYF36_020014 [Acer negundo]|nr:hypothetical protein QYF36_020014 [Acer negundo]
MPNGKSLETAIDANNARAGGLLGLGPTVSYTHSPMFGYNGLTTAPGLSYSSGLGHTSATSMEIGKFTFILALPSFANIIEKSRRPDASPKIVDQTIVWYNVGPISRPICLEYQTFIHLSASFEEGSC